VRPVPSANLARRPASEVPAITGLRFLPQGATASLVNISTTGLLAESAARLQVGAAVRVQFEGRFAPTVVAGRVARCEVAVMGLDGLLQYYIGVEFDAPLALDGEVTERREAPPPRAIRNRW
jgi:hypothetical protein